MDELLIIYNIKIILQLDIDDLSLILQLVLDRLIKRV